MSTSMEGKQVRVVGGTQPSTTTAQTRGWSAGQVSMGTPPALDACGSAWSPLPRIRRALPITTARQKPPLTSSVAMCASTTKRSIGTTWMLGQETSSSCQLICPT